MTNTAEVNFSITFKNLDSSQAVKDYTQEKLSNCLKKFLHKNTDAHVMLKVEKNRHIAEVSFHADGHDFACKEESHDLYASIDALCSTVTHQVKKHKEKLTNHH